MKRTIYLIVVLLLATVSCKKTVELPIQILEPSLDRIMAPKFEADFVITLETNTSWRAVVKDADWVDLDKYENVGASDVTISIKENTGEERCGKLIFTSVDGKLERTVTVSQMSSSSGDFMPISSVRSLERIGGYTFPFGKIRGYVLSDYKAKNYEPGTIAIADDFTRPRSGITVQCDTSLKFAPGMEVEINLENALLKRSDSGCLELYPEFQPTLTPSTQISTKAVELTYDKLLSGDYESMKVTIVKYQPGEKFIGGTFASNPVIENKEGNRVQLKVMESSPFAGEKYKKGSGNVTGLSCGTKNGLPVIYPQSISDVGFGNFRIGELPGIKKLPYIFSFYCSEQTDECPKYIDYSPVAWSPTTKMFDGVIAKDKDEGNGAFLTVRAFASDISKTYNSSGLTRMWAESHSNDNVNCTGFCSPDGKTAPTYECGWFLTIPLQVDLPQQFNVFFGLAIAEWSIASWAVSYSYDEIDWYNAGTVSVKHFCEGGSYYYHYCVSINTVKPFLADNTLYLKFTPFGTEAGNPANSGKADGHGSSCFIRLHSSIIIADASIPKTEIPEGAVYFEPFDKLNEGVDFFSGEKIGGMANFCGSDISRWTPDQKNGLTGTNVRQRPGYAQIGYANDEDTGSNSVMENEAGSLTIPALGRSGDFTITFKAGAYRTTSIRPNATATVPDVKSPDITDAVLVVNGGGTINGSTRAMISNMPYDYKTREYSFAIKGATASTTLTFKSEPTEGQFSRWFLDDILVK